MIRNYLSNPLSMSLQGVQDGIAGMENAARKIARGGVDGPQGTAGSTRDMIEPMADLQLYARSVEATAQVAQTHVETLRPQSGIK